MNKFIAHGGSTNSRSPPSCSCPMWFPIYRALQEISGVVIHPQLCLNLNLNFKYNFINCGFGLMFNYVGMKDHYLNYYVDRVDLFRLFICKSKKKQEKKQIIRWSAKMQYIPIIRKKCNWGNFQVVVSTPLSYTTRSLVEGKAPV